MAGKASLLLAALLFGMGAVGLALTAGETTRWGPFDAPEASVARQPLPPAEGPVLSAVAIPPTLQELAPEPFAAVTAPVTLVERNAVADFVATEPPAPAPAPAEAPATPTPEPRPPLLVHGVASDSASAGAAGATPRPLFFGMIGRDTDETPAPVAPTEQQPSDTPTAMPTVDPGEKPEPLSTPAPPAE